MKSGKKGLKVVGACQVNWFSTLTLIPISSAVLVRAYLIFLDISSKLLFLKKVKVAVYVISHGTFSM